eukprot:scaffold768_cov382-Prasinococcus_capsulatus_cf.AAC.3
MCSAGSRAFGRRSRARRSVAEVSHSVLGAAAGQVVYPQAQYASFDEFMQVLWGPAEAHFDAEAQRRVGDDPARLHLEQQRDVQLVPFHPLAHFEGAPREPRARLPAGSRRENGVQPPLFGG